MPITKQDWKELGVGLAAFAASFLVKKLLENGYREVFQEEPPDKAEREEEPDWVRLIGWTMVSGLAATATKTLVKRKGKKQIKD